MSESLWLTVGDTPVLSGKINAATVGASAQVHIKPPTGSVVNRAATTLDDNGDGTSSWSLALIDGDVAVVGEYQIEVEVTFSDSSVQTFALDANGRQSAFRVRAAIA